MNRALRRAPPGVLQFQARPDVTRVLANPGAGDGSEAGSRLPTAHVLRHVACYPLTMRRHPTYGHPQRFDPEVAAWRIVLAIAVLAPSSWVRSLFGR